LSVCIKSLATVLSCIELRKLSMSTVLMNVVNKWKYHAEEIIQSLDVNEYLMVKFLLDNNQ